MRRKIVLRREAALEDGRRATIYYAREGGPDVAGRFVAALEGAYRSIREHPRLGSPRFGEVLGIDGLRTRRVRRFPYMVFYVEAEDRVEVWRVLHVQADISAETFGAAS